MSSISSTILLFCAFLAFGTFVSAFRGGMPIPLTPSNEFAACCQAISPSLREDTIKDCCKFPPENPTTVEARDLGQIGHWNPYVKCYTNKKDNRECCKEHGVVGKYKICQQLCDGTHKHPAPPSSLMYVCETSYIKGNISMCNEAAYPHQDE